MLKAILMNKIVRTRFAPSPTGSLHLGGVRTALYNYLWAKKNGGEYLLRVEDTDLERSTAESTAQIMESFAWLGLQHDGEIVYQSQRLNHYREALESLWAAEKIYPAFESEAELQQARETAEAEKRTYIYSGASQYLGRAEASTKMDAGERFLWRLRVPMDGTTEVAETLQSDSGIVTFANNEIGDFPLTRMGTREAPGMVLYNFCNVVDDHAQQITHVIRGAEHLVNTPKQVLLYRAFGWEPPTFTHLPLIMKNGKKMSKRDKDTDPRATVSVTERRDAGYLPEAMLNFMALLGWSFSGTEEFASLPEMVQLFDVQKLSKSNANFDEDKFLHFNAWYIRHLPRDEIVARVLPFLQQAGYVVDHLPAAWLADVIGLAVDKAKLLTDFVPALKHFFETPQGYDEKAATLFTSATASMLRDVLQVVGECTDTSAAGLEAAVKAYMAEKGLKPKDVMMPLRLALTGTSTSPGSIFETMALLGRPTTASRIDAAITYCEKA